MGGPQLVTVRQGAQCLVEGGVIAYPTEAVYGLGCDPDNEAAVRHILRLKSRPESAGLILILMLALVGAVLWQVAARYLMRSPSSWTEEIARFLLIWISLLGAVYAFRNGAHLGLDLLPQKLGGIAGVRLRRLTLLLVAGFAAVVLVVGGAGLVWLTWDLAQYSAVLGLPMSVVYLVLPFSGLLICLYAAAAWPAPENRSPTPIAPGGE